MKSFNNLTHAEAERLALLLEELGEAQQAIGKVLRHGYGSTHPDGGPNNKVALERELGDVRCATWLLCDAGDLDNENIEASAGRKIATVSKYMHHQPKAGLM